MSAPFTDVSPQKCHVLLIEDDPDDAFIFEHAFRQSGIDCAIHTVQTIKDAMALLKNEPPFSDPIRFPTPSLIVTDLAFRGESGLAFLNWFHYQSIFRHIPVICVSGTSDPNKLEQAAAFGARCIPKSVLCGEIIDLIRELLPAR